MATILPLTGGGRSGDDPEVPRRRLRVGVISEVSGRKGRLDHPVTAIADAPRARLRARGDDLDEA